MVKMTEKQQRDLLIAAGLGDFATRGRLTAVAYDALKATVSRGGSALLGTTRRAAPTVGRIAGRSALRLAGTAATIAMRHPVLTAGAIIYVNRDQASELLREGYDVVQEGVPSTSSMITPQELMEAVGRPQGIKKPKKPTKYNRAVKAGMAAVKRSKFGGKKGTISNAKTTFATVNRVASAVNKGKKVNNTGIRGVAARAIRRIL
jgi:hypothetical protein